jgi:Zn-dependent protease with chaperone function
MIKLLNDIYMETGISILKIKKKDCNRFAYSTLFGTIIISKKMDFFPNDEIKAVILHEYAHIKFRHHLRLLGTGIFYLVILSFIIIKIPVFILLFIPVFTGLAVLARVLYESEADRFVVNKGYGQSLINFIERIQSSEFDFIYGSKEQRIKRIKGI